MNIDEEKIRSFLEKAKFERSLDINPNLEVREALERLNLIKDGELTNAALLLFGKNPQKFFLQAEVRCARFKGIKPLEFIDMKVLDRNIIDQVDAAEDFVLRHISMAAWIEPGKIERQEKWEYPPDAVREAMVNAIAHRNYESTGNVQVRIFEDRIEIWGCGPLPEPLTPEDLKKKHKSVLRNPLIAKCFFMIRFIEQWGTGTNKIIEWCLSHGLPEPLFEEVAGDFVVTLRKYHITEEVLKELNERQRKAVEYLLKNKKITNREYRELNPGISDRTALNDLNNLISKGVIIPKGTKKFRSYILL